LILHEKGFTNILVPGLRILLLDRAEPALLDRFFAAGISWRGQQRHQLKDDIGDDQVSWRNLGFKTVDRS